MKKFFNTLLMFIIVFGLKSQCIGPMEEFSTFPLNPVTYVNGIFQFDYRIVSSIEISASYQNHEGGLTSKVSRYNVDFFVNSADGSAYFPTGFFVSNFGSSTNGKGNIQGAIWKADGQMVSYVYDAEADQKRAIVVETNQSFRDVELGQLAFISRFIEGIRTATNTPAPIPVDLPWGNTEGFVSEVVQPDGSKAKITIYFALNPDIPHIKTSVPLVGFLTGIVKDVAFHNCNRLAVFSRMENMGSPDYIQSELFSIKKDEATFNGNGYKKMTLGGGAGTDIQAQLAAFKIRLRDLHDRRQRLDRRRKACGSNKIVGKILTGSLHFWKKIQLV